MKDFIDKLKERILSGGEITENEAMLLADIQPDDYVHLYNAATEITSKYSSRKFDSCSIINARSGKCPEDCHWCAQSAHFKTGASTYPLVDKSTSLKAAEMNRHHGIHRFSFVTSGRRLSPSDIDLLCGYAADIKAEGGLDLCASLGLLDKEALQKLVKAGIKRYHCNLETAPSYFPQLCSTHTIDDKLHTILLAREAGMEICSGGIIGMGESRKQRIEFALTLRTISPDSIPINVLQPIKGTPLENADPLSQEEILLTVAIFRLIHPKAVLRFAGGRAQISLDTQEKSMHIGVNGAIMGDMLTTIGSQVEDDKRLIAKCGYEF